VIPGDIVVDEYRRIIETQPGGQRWDEQHWSQEASSAQANCEHVTREPADVTRQVSGSTSEAALTAITQHND
jgi:hypothetical protein